MASTVRTLDLPRPVVEKLDRRDEARVAYQKALDSGKLAPALAEAVEQRLR
jgi:hypothetical protein